MCGALMSGSRGKTEPNREGLARPGGCAGVRANTMTKTCPRGFWRALSTNLASVSKSDRSEGFLRGGQIRLSEILTDHRT